MNKHTVEHYMTASPHSIGRNQTLSMAHRIMRDNRVRHLPVLDKGELVGVISDRDLHLIESLKDVDPDSVTVEDAMVPDPYVVDGSSPLDEVASTMMTRKLGSAIVVDSARHVIGVFTTTDALSVLLDLLKSRRS